MLTDKKILQVRKVIKGDTQREVFKTLADTNRYHIFTILVKYPRLTVTEIATILQISIPLASQHLKILEQAKLLAKEKLGQKVHYFLGPKNRLAQVLIKENL